MTRLGHMPALDGVRGIAIAAVLVYHAYGVPGGFLGVDLFFVLSGFLITSLLIEEHADQTRISLRGFYRRRARRLLPVALAGIVAGEVLLLGSVAATGHSSSQLLVGFFAAFYAENFAHFLHPRVVSQLGHYWSLSQEEQFYLLWPPLFALLMRRRIPRPWLVGGLLVTAVGIAVHRALLAGSDWWRFYYAPDARADGILLGCALAIVWKAGWLPGGRLWAAAAPLALAIYLADVATLRHTASATALYGITVANGAAAVMIASIVMAPQALLARLLALGPLVWLGAVSYSVYIWQPLVASATGVGGSLMLILVAPVAWGSYRLIEQPFRRRLATASSSPLWPVNERGADPAPAPADSA